LRVYASVSYIRLGPVLKLVLSTHVTLAPTPGVTHVTLAFIPRVVHVLIQKATWQVQDKSPYKSFCHAFLQELPLASCARLSQQTVSLFNGNLASPRQVALQFFLSCIPAGAAIGILPKIESADSVGHLSDILDAADGAMVARGDLGAELPVQDVSASHCLLPHQAQKCYLVLRSLELYSIFQAVVDDKQQILSDTIEQSCACSECSPLWLLSH